MANFTSPYWQEFFCHSCDNDDRSICAYSWPVTQNRCSNDNLIAYRAMEGYKPSPHYGHARAELTSWNWVEYWH